MNTEPNAETFCIDSEERANWYARKLAGFEAERARVKAQAARIVAQLDGDEKSLKDRFEAEAREWARAELDRRYKGRRCVPCSCPRRAENHRRTAAGRRARAAARRLRDLPPVPARPGRER